MFSDMIHLPESASLSDGYSLVETECLPNAPGLPAIGLPKDNLVESALLPTSYHVPSSCQLAGINPSPWSEDDTSLVSICPDDNSCWPKENFALHH